MKVVMLIIVLIFAQVNSFQSERYYQATGVLLTQKTTQGTRSRGFNIGKLFLRINPREISIYGQQSGKTITKTFDVYRTDHDTLFVDYRDNNFNTHQIKFHFKGDTLLSNSNFLSDAGPTAEHTEIRVILRELDITREREIIELFR
ncbi:hypothetical protein CHISP_0431 [Chitinispirillum alkaliphilum]|nr:hypothetical protein CHISP_0431 [Chitinispirillum alkaliphilum]